MRWWWVRNSEPTAPQGALCQGRLRPPRVAGVSGFPWSWAAAVDQTSFVAEWVSC